MSLGPFSHGCRSGPRLPCAESNPEASALPSSMLTLLLTVGRELLLLKSYCGCPCQELSQLRELSISLFRDLVNTMVRNSKRQVNVQMGWLPLLFHMSDETQSVAKVQLSELSSGAGKRAQTFGPGHVPAS